MAVLKVDTLPTKIRTEFDRKLIEQGYGGYKALSEWLKEQGHSVSVDAIGDYSKRLKADINKLRVSHSFAIAYGHDLPDEDGMVTKMLTGLTQDILYRVLIRLHVMAVDLDKDDDLGNVWTVLKLLDSTTKSLSTVSRSDVAALALTKYADDMRAKQEARFAELQAEGQAAGISPEFMDRMRREILNME